MKRYIIQSGLYSGMAELWYNETDQLIRIDVSKANMNSEVLEYFKRTAPVVSRDLVQAFEGVASSITEGEIVVSFLQFWAKYDRKINKARCIPLWNKLGAGEQVKAFTGIDKYNAYLKRESWRTKLDPENYLKNKTWENEYK